MINVYWHKSKLDILYQCSNPSILPINSVYRPAIQLARQGGPGQTRLLALAYIVTRPSRTGTTSRYTTTNKQQLNNCLWTNKQAAAAAIQINKGAEPSWRGEGRKQRLRFHKYIQGEGGEGLQG